MGASFSTYRPRRLRRTPALRRLIQETTLNPRQLVAPMFVTLQSKKRVEVPSMPGVFRLSIPEAAKEAKELAKRGIGGALLFGIPGRKDTQASGAYAPNGIIQQAVKTVKQIAPELVVMTDVCLCEYTDHGHCGILTGGGSTTKGGGPTAGRPAKQGVPIWTASYVDNDATLEVLGQIAVSHAQAGADLVAPSAMMDGQVKAIRTALDQAGFSQVPIMSYSAKYASALYGPFREAVQSAPSFGDRRGYQMDPPNREEALREVALDIQEGADVVMVKPASLYLDVLRSIKETFHWPTAAYQVSGEYALIKAAALKGWVEEKRLVLESVTAIRRAGADLIITYYAKQLAQWLGVRHFRTGAQEGLYESA